MVLLCRTLTYNAIEMNHKTAEVLQSGSGGSMNLAVSDFARILGVDVKELSPRCMDAIRSSDFRHHVRSGEDREKALLRVIKAVDSAFQECIKARKF